MGEIVAAFGVCHSPHLLTRPPDEVPEQSEASIGAMREMGKVLDETKPDVIVFLGSDHLDTFSMTCVPTFAIICGERVIADHVGHHYDLPNNREMAEDFLDKVDPGRVRHGLLRGRRPGPYLRDAFRIFDRKAKYPGRAVLHQRLPAAAADRETLCGPGRRDGRGHQRAGKNGSP